MTRPARRLLDALACALVAVLGATALVALVVGVSLLLDRHDRRAGEGAPAMNASCPCAVCRVCNAIATGILVAFPAAALASLELPPFGIVVCAALGALAVIWIVR